MSLFFDHYDINDEDRGYDDDDGGGGHWWWSLVVVNGGGLWWWQLWCWCWWQWQRLMMMAVTTLCRRKGVGGDLGDVSCLLSRFCLSSYSSLQTSPFCLCLCLWLDPRQKNENHGSKSFLNSPSLHFNGGQKDAKKLLHRVRPCIQRMHWCN